MKRIFVSILGGILLPGFLLVGASIISQLLPQYDLEITRIDNALAPGYIFAPVALPIYAYTLYPPPPSYQILHTIWFRFLVSALFDFFLYAILTFAVIKYFGLFESRKKQTQNSLPPPPEIYKEEF